MSAGADQPTLEVRGLTIALPAGGDRSAAVRNVSFSVGRGEIVSDKGTFRFLPLPESVIGILEAGGLLEYTKKKLATAATPKS